VQLTTDGNNVYLNAVEHYLGGKVDYAMLVKQYGEEKNPERTYSPAKCLGAKKRQIDGEPDMELVSTSYAERQKYQDAEPPLYPSDKRIQQEG
jgi:hypothetical protein